MDGMDGWMDGWMSEGGRQSHPPSLHSLTDSPSPRRRAAWGGGSGMELFRDG